jgi:alkylation response protein AidB-like acyl-CoA dehydrogenase
MKFNKILCFGLTEIDNGSDASGLITESRPTEKGYVINGNKRWIGNATFADYMILWARNTDNKKIQGFIVDMNLPGIKK